MGRRARGEGPPLLRRPQRGTRRQRRLHQAVGHLPPGRPDRGADRGVRRPRPAGLPDAARLLLRQHVCRLRDPVAHARPRAGLGRGGGAGPPARRGRPADPRHVRRGRDPPAPARVLGRALRVQHPGRPRADPAQGAVLRGRWPPPGSPCPPTGASTGRRGRRTPSARRPAWSDSKRSSGRPHPARRRAPWGAWSPSSRRPAARRSASTSCRRRRRTSPAPSRRPSRPRTATSWSRSSSTGPSSRWWCSTGPAAGRRRSLRPRWRSRRTDLVYGTEEKYLHGSGVLHHTPMRVDAEVLHAIRARAAEAFAVLGLRHMARIDGFRTTDGTIVVTDVNGIGGMGFSSFVFQQAAMVGIDHRRLIMGLLGAASGDARRHGRGRRRPHRRWPAGSTSSSGGPPASARSADRAAASWDCRCWPPGTTSGST